MWVKIFAVTFGMGVVTGMVLSYQFGTNWSVFADKVGNVLGPLLGYEVLTAFFMEATFLGIMLFGINRVPVWVHTLSTFCVAVGTTLSAFWIIALNSWMHTPAGYELIDGVFYPASWWQIVFNPSMPWRLIHVLLASTLTAAFLIAGLSAWRMLQGDRSAGITTALRAAIIVAALTIPLQIFSGDLHGLNTLKHQPAKVAAMEGLWQTESGAPFVLIGWPDPETQTNLWSIEIPNAASLILTHKLDGEVQGLGDFEHTPPVAPVFFSFRIMLATGFAMLAAAAWGFWRIVWQRKYARVDLRVFVVMTFSGWVGTLAGWYVTEIGRQPWLISGLMTTAETVTTQPPQNVAISLTVYSCLYGFLLISYISSLYYLAHKAGDLETQAEPLPTTLATA